MRIESDNNPESNILTLSFEGHDEIHAVSAAYQEYILRLRRHGNEDSVTVYHENIARWSIDANGEGLILKPEDRRLLKVRRLDGILDIIKAFVNNTDEVVGILESDPTNYPKIEIRENRAHTAQQIIEDLAKYVISLEDHGQPHLDTVEDLIDDINNKGM